MLIVQVDHGHPEALQACIARRADIFRTAIDAKETAVAPPDVPELGRKNDLLPVRAECFADKFFVLPDTIHVRRVEEGNAELDCAVDRGDRFGIIPAGIEIRHPHASEPERRYL